MDIEYKFATEYAKSSRSCCKSCKDTINKDTLRMATMVQSSHFDGKIPIWFHFNCFFKKSTISNLESIKGIHMLRWDDQEKIKNKLSAEGSDSATTDYSIEYAKSNRSKCGQCEEKIEKKEIRFSQMETESEKTKMLGAFKRWYHINCTEHIKEEIKKKTPQFDIEKISGFTALNDEDRKILIQKFKKWKSKKRALANSVPDVDTNKKAKISNKSTDTKMKKQSDLIWKTRDQLSKEVTKKILSQLLEYNNQYIPGGESDLLDSVADCMVFGALPRCSECSGKLKYLSNHYACGSYVNEWTKCLYQTREVTRSSFNIPDEYLDTVPMFRKYVCKPKTRILHAEKETAVQLPEPLKGFTLAVDRVRFDENHNVAQIKQHIKSSGGDVSSKLTATTAVLISIPNSSSHNVKLAESLSIDVVSVDFLENLNKEPSVEAAVKKYSIVTWGRSIDELTSLRVGKSKPESKNKEKSKTDMKVFTVKGGAAVDPDSGLAEKAHVFQEPFTCDPLNVVLGKVDVVRGSNSYYKLQLLESDKRGKYWVFRAWGRIGTTIGSYKLEKFISLDEARLQFETLYLDRTGNHWADRKSFDKKPGLFAPIDVDYGQDANLNEDIEDDACNDSKLSLAVQELIRFVFDMESMKKAMLEFEIDLNQMPLGKLSKKQIDISYGILKQLQTLLTGSDSLSKTTLFQLSNQFYTMMPHNFGLRVPPLIDSLKMVKEKCEMIESLMEMEVAYKLMKSDGGASGLDSKYDKLQNRITQLARDCDQFRRLEQYVENTHAPTHTGYRIRVQEIYEIDRVGEIDRFHAFRELPNHMMLWHGSRRTNWAGILSQGLRIAPPEAPVTGYMFGKGLYFADMVTKSSNYCHSSPDAPDGLLMLCEVALGTMTERYKCDEDLVLKPGEHSCKGVGGMAPDSTESFKDSYGVLYPMGKPVTQKVKSTLLYNEYIVYDVAQVRQRYLFKVHFDFSTRKRR